MTEKEILEGAPDGATHYDYFENEYMRYYGGGDWKHWVSGEWKQSIIDIDYVIENFKPL